MFYPKEKLQLISVAIFLFCCSCGASLNKSSALGDTEIGLACFYSDKLHGKTTASGEIYNKKKLTAAHKNLPFGTKIKVINLNNRKSVQVVINDRGPFGDRHRIIDLSRKAAKTIEMINAGVIEVELLIIGKP